MDLIFHEGYRDFLINALPILLRHRSPTIVFRATDRLGQTAAWSRRRPKVPVTTVDTSNFSKADTYRLDWQTVHYDLDLDAFNRMIAGPSWLQRISVLAQTRAHHV